jgi:hypothetical protein
MEPEMTPHIIYDWKCPKCGCRCSGDEERAHPKDYPPPPYYCPRCQDQTELVVDRPQMGQSNAATLSNARKAQEALKRLESDTMTTYWKCPKCDRTETGESVCLEGQNDFHVCTACAGDTKGVITMLQVNKDGTPYKSILVRRIEQLQKQLELHKAPAPPPPHAGGWVCPVCGRGMAPWADSCPCKAMFPPAPPPWTCSKGSGDPLPDCGPVVICHTSGPETQTIYEDKHLGATPDLPERP